jgi:hypothetical protein
MRTAMNAATDLYRRIFSSVKPPAASEPAFGTPRKAIGLFSSLTDEQKKAVLSYSGPQDHGEDEFRRR